MNQAVDENHVFRIRNFPLMTNPYNWFSLIGITAADSKSTQKLSPITRRRPT